MYKVFSYLTRKSKKMQTLGKDQEDPDVISLEKAWNLSQNSCKQHRKIEQIVKDVTIFCILSKHI